MSSFEVLIERVAKVEQHPNADRLDLVQIRGYKCVSAKKSDGTPRYAEGDLVVYIPEDSIVPEAMLRCGFWDETLDKGILAGTDGNRVKAIKLRGALSQGILFSVNPYEGYDEGAHFVLSERFPDEEFPVGRNVAELLGVTKFVPEIPPELLGDVTYIGSNVLKFDVENIKKYPDVMPGHDVVMEEKLHGICVIFGYVPGLGNPEMFRVQNEYDFFVTSKGLGAQGLAFTNSNENVYVQVFLENQIALKLKEFSKDNDDQPVYFVGEIYGKGVQDLAYGLTDKRLALFGAFVGTPQEGKWVDPENKYALFDALGLPKTPLLYKGEFSQEKLDEFTNGKSALDGKTIREGVVVTPLIGFDDMAIGRAILKSVSEAYLLRKGGTEYQ